MDQENENSEVIKCIKLLKNAKSDNERFAALLMVTKAVKVENCCEKSRQQLFEAVGFKFITRLLRTGNTPEGCSPHAYKSLAAAVLSSFCSSAHLTGSKEMYDCIPYLNDIIMTNAVEAERDEETVAPMVNDSYECFTCLARQSEGRQALVRHKAVAAFAAAVVDRCYNWERASSILEALIKTSGDEVWRFNQDALTLLLVYYTRLLVQYQDEEKFESCKQLYMILASMNLEQMKAVKGSWLLDMKEELCKLLQSRLVAGHRQIVLQIFAHLIDLNGTTWLIGEDKDRLESNKKYLLILAHLTCAEIRLTLEDHLFEKIQESEEMLSAGYGLLENIISFLTVGPQLGLDSRQVSQLHTALMGAFNSVIFFLTQVRDEYPEKKLQSVVLASVRALGAWIAEETTALKKEVIGILPFLLEIGQDTMSSNNDLNRQLQDLTVKDEPSRNIPDIMQFLLPGLCHLSADDVSRKVVLDSEGLELLAKYFSLQWSRWNQNREHSDAHVALVALCGIFLNLVVLERELSVRHPAFGEFLAFLMSTFSSFADSREQTVLSFNFMTIGLMLLRLHVENKTGVVSQGQMENFVDGSLRLLKNVHCAKQGKKRKTFCLQEGIEQHWDLVQDLWCLSMQIMSHLITLLPFVPQKILKTGWLLSIAKLLGDTIGSAKPDEAIITAYQELLCALASRSEDARNILKDSLRKDTARSYNMTEVMQFL